MPPEPPSFPPVPTWRPAFGQSLDRLVERARFYTNGLRDIAVFRHGTMVILRNGLTDAEATDAALTALDSVYHAHPDMNPLLMTDGNVLIQYAHDAATIVLSDTAMEHRGEIEDNHLAALTPGEVLFTPDGPNVFDDFGQVALFGRCYLFMDAQDPEVVRVERAAS